MVTSDDWRALAGKQAMLRRTFAVALLRPLHPVSRRGAGSWSGAAKVES
jgi:hypothetical protein